LGVEVSSSL